MYRPPAWPLYVLHSDHRGTEKQWASVQDAEEDRLGRRITTHRSEINFPSVRIIFRVILTFHKHCFRPYARQADFSQGD
jgi:hypothetical protein